VRLLGLFALEDMTLFQWVAFFQKKVVDNFLICALFIAVLIAFSYPYPGKLVAQIRSDNIKVIDFINNVVVFLISGLSLRIEDLKSVYTYKFLVIYGLISINLITTFIAFATILLPFPTHQYAVGLTIFSTVPTTLGVGVALTNEAKGDKILALFLTVVSNLLGILTIPLLLTWYLQHQSIDGNNSFNAKALSYRLLYTVFIPTLSGILTRRFLPGCAKVMDTYKQYFSMFSISNLMCIVWMSLSGARNMIFQQNPLEIFLVFITAVLIHLIFLFYNYFLLIFSNRWFQKDGSYWIPLQQAIAVMIMSSQKSSPIALSVIAVVAQNSIENQGLMTIPCILGQIGQIFIGSILVPYFARWVTNEEETSKMMITEPTPTNRHHQIKNEEDEEALVDPNSNDERCHIEFILVRDEEAVVDTGAIIELHEDKEEV
jgi:solute carrier family 10 (sodium/bile acid cotransporter), member 7